MRLIDADAIKISKGFFEKVDNVPKFYGWLDEQPTIDPVKHGKWIEARDLIDNQTFSECKCSECGVVEYFNKGGNDLTTARIVALKWRQNEDIHR